jgi:signal transduction histidine kinase
MGLSICRSIIEAHDGRLWVAPNQPEGAVFQFMLLAYGATSAVASQREQLDESRLVRTSDASTSFGSIGAS